MKKSKLHPKLFGYMKNQEEKYQVVLHLCGNYKKHLTHYFPFINVGIACVGMEEAKQLARKSEISYISPCATVSTQMIEAKQNMNYQNLSLDRYYGSGKHLCVIDTGVHPHLDLMLESPAIEGFFDCINGEETPYDDNGHGTMTSSVALSRGLMSGGIFSGVAPRAKLISVKAIPSSGNASTVEILQGMQYVFDNVAKNKIDVCNMSFGAEYMGAIDPIVIGAEKLMDRGVLVVSASGNSGENTIKSPGISRKILTIGSCEKNGENEWQTAKYSSGKSGRISTNPDAVTSGTNIVSASIDGEYDVFTGTSVSCGIASGIALVLKEKLGIYNSYKLKEAVIENCKSYGEPQDRQGSGRIEF